MKPERAIDVTGITAASRLRGTPRSNRTTRALSTGMLVLASVVGSFATRSQARESTTPAAVDLGRSMKSLAKEHPTATAQKKLLGELRVKLESELPWLSTAAGNGVDRYFASFAALAADLATNAPIVANRFGEIHFAGAVDDDPFDPRCIRYEFGSHGLRALKDGAPAKKTTATANSTALTAIDRLAWLSLGIPEDAELTLAAIERALDVDHGADALFAFLDYWRNADESFYEALDRTAGSPEGIFHYDSMLDQYATEFISKEERKAKDFITRGRDAVHDRFHDAFLTGRKYRNLVEGIAYSLLLPPDVPLPTRLSRFDFTAVQGSALSVRDQVLILLADADGDIAQAIAFVTRVLTDHPLPPDLFQGDGYDPVTALATEVIAKVGITDAATRAWVREWGGDPATIHRHRDIADAYRHLRATRADALRGAAARHLHDS